MNRDGCGVCRLVFAGRLRELRFARSQAQLCMRRRSTKRRGLAGPWDVLAGKEQCRPGRGAAGV